jgi:ubiquitin carboxyl-terminal hydrolase 14
VDLGDGSEQKVALTDKLFDIETVSTFKNKECPEEPETTSTEHANKLACTIEGGSEVVNHMIEGLKLSMTGDIEKRSDTLDRNCVYTKETQVNKLPSYLMVQFVRFYWKKESNVAGTKAGKAKILKSVNFPKVFDMYPICTRELKNSLDLGRDFQIKEKERLDDIAAGAKKDQNGDVEMTDESAKKPENSKEEEEKSRSTAHSRAMEEARKKRDETKKEDEILYRNHGTGLDTGNYQLIGVVTHKGRSADGGHYIGWVHTSGDDWHQYDDDIVSSVKTEEILNLKGGGDWHTAYLCLYRKLEVTRATE